MPPKVFKITLLIVALTTLQAGATIIHVPGDQLTIQAGINAASNGDTVLVEPGTYLENVNFRSKGITVASRFLTTLDNAFVDSTVIDGSSPVYPDTGSCVLITAPNSSTSQDTSAALIGFKITGGTGTKWQDEHGAGLYREGGGVLVEYLSPRIRHNKIIGNRSANTSGVVNTGGGGLRCGDGNPRIENNQIISNFGHYGGGIVLNFTAAIVRNNIIAYDTATTAYLAGGGIWINGNGTGLPQIINNTIALNSAASQGSNVGGIAIYAGNPFVENNIVWENTGVFEIFSQNLLIVSYCDVQGGWIGSGVGDIDLDPGFTRLDYFYLADTSHCIDAGDVGSDYYDPENPLNPGQALWPAEGSVRNDMGVYGGPGCLSFEGSVSAVNPIITPALPTGFSMQSYPNPFNASVTIRYNYPGAQLVSLTIYNTQGREIRSFTRQNPGAGHGQFTWDSKDGSGASVVSGIYLCRLEGGSRKLTSKIVLLK